jgi:hypothetical protein
MLSSRWCGTGLLFLELSTYFAFRHVKHVVNREEFLRDTRQSRKLTTPISTYFAFRHVKHVVNSEEFLRDTRQSRKLTTPTRVSPSAEAEIPRLKVVVVGPLSHAHHLRTIT